MKVKSTVLLLFLVVGLGGLIWYVERQEAGTREQRRRESRAVRVRADNVDYLRIEHTNYVMVCRREQGQWRLEEPLISFADNGAVNRILRGLEDLPRWDVITEDERRTLHAGLHDYGLALPDVRIVFRQDGVETELRIGDPAAVGDGLYIMETDRPDVVVTSQSLWDLIPAAAEEVRSRRLFPGAVTRLLRLEIQRTAGFLQLARTEENGPWMIQQPVVARASGRFVRDLASKFLNLEIEEFIADDVKDFAPYGLDEPAAEITLWPEAAAGPYTIVVGRTVDDHPDWVYARTAHGNSVYALSRQVLSDATLDENVLRDRDLLHLRLAAVGYVEIRAGETVIELEKDDAGSWGLTKPVVRPADDETVWRTIEGWNRMRIRSFYPYPAPDNGDRPLSQARARVTIASRRPADGAEEGAAPLRDGKERVVMFVYTAPWAEGEALVRLRHEDALYGIPEQALTSTSLNPLDYYDRHVLQLAPADVRRIEIRRDGRVQGVQRNEAEEFTPASNQRGPIVPGVVENILADVGNLRARRFVADDPDDLEAYGLAEPSLSVRLGLTGEAGISKTLLFGRRVEPDGVFAMIQGHTTVFELPVAVRDRMGSDVLIQPTNETEASSGSAAGSGDSS